MIQLNKTTNVLHFIKSYAKKRGTENNLYGQDD